MISFLKTKAVGNQGAKPASFSALAFVVLCVFAFALILGNTPAAEVRTFTNPIADSGADPWVIRWNGLYYYCYSKADAIWIKAAENLEDIGFGDEACVWAPPEGTRYSKEIWAPELHFLDGKWYIYFAADDGNNDNHRMYVLESLSKDPQGGYRFKGKIAAATDRWAIDGTVLETGAGARYFVWSGWEGRTNVRQNLYIAPMGNPWTIKGDRTMISTPEYPWELKGQPYINEGPEALQKDGKTFIIYSASGSWTDDYCLGQLALVGDDPLKKGSWSKKAQPVFSKTSKVFGPGHASFVKSPDGREDWIVYHSAKSKGAGWNRQVNIQRFSWNKDGSPDFGRPVPPDAPLQAPSGSR